MPCHPAHTDRNALRNWFSDQELIFENLRRAASDESLDEPNILAGIVEAVCEAAETQFNAFVDIWAHDCAAFDAIDQRLKRLEESQSPEGQLPHAP